MKLFVILLFLSIIPIPLFSQQLNIIEKTADKNGAEYSIVNNTSEPYIFWVDRDTIETSRELSGKDMLRYFRRFSQYRPDPVPDGYASLSFWLTDQNVVFLFDEMEPTLGISYMHRISPGEKFIVKVKGDKSRQQFYRARFATMPESIYYVEIDNHFITPDNPFVIDFSDRTSFMEEIRNAK